MEPIESHGIVERGHDSMANKSRRRRRIRKRKFGPNRRLSYCLLARIDLTCLEMSQALNRRSEDESASFGHIPLDQQSDGHVRVPEPSLKASLASRIGLESALAFIQISRDFGKVATTGSAEREGSRLARSQGTVDGPGEADSESAEREEFDLRGCTSSPQFARYQGSTETGDGFISAESAGKGEFHRQGCESGLSFELALSQGIPEAGEFGKADSGDTESGQRPEQHLDVVRRSGGHQQAAAEEPRRSMSYTFVIPVKRLFDVVRLSSLSFVFNIVFVPHRIAEVILSVLRAAVRKSLLAAITF